MRFYLGFIFALIIVIIAHMTVRSMFVPAYKMWSGGTEEIRELIVDEAKRQGVRSDFALFLAQVESNFNPNAKNPRSSATGLFQFIDGTWQGNCEGNRLDPKDNTRCAMELLGSGGIHHWTVDPRTAKKLRNAGFIQ